MLFKDKVHFIGIAGIGMSAIAQVLLDDYEVSGSDRAFDNNIDLEFKALLENINIKIHKQDGSGIDKNTNLVIYSSSIESNIPDLQKAKELNITCIHRSDMLATIFNKGYGIAISGTSGKTTSCAFLGYMLYRSNFDPKMINGGKAINFCEMGLIGNAYCGKTKHIVIEADESDGTLVKYIPNISIITNIDLDHKPIEELYSLFTSFANNTKDYLIINADCLHTRNIAHSFANKNIISFGLDKSADYVIGDILLNKDSSSFSLNKDGFRLSISGYHNILNCIPSIIVGDILNIKRDIIKDSILGFKGVEGRLNIVNTIKGIDIISDYAHNPSKIRASIECVRIDREGIIVIFQPHGFAPTRLMRDDYIKTFTDCLTDKDIIFITEILYQGGTVDRDISSREIVEAINKGDKLAYFFYSREDIINFLNRNPTLLSDKQAILVMGARDNTLRDFSRGINF